MKKALYILFIFPVCVLSLLTIIYVFSSDVPMFIIKNIKINGVSQLKDSEVISRVSPFLKDSLFNIDVMKMKEAVVSHPFVREVRIKTVFPFSVVIDVKEKKPSALWVDCKGDVMTLDESGEPYKGISKGEVKGMFIINTKDKNDLKNIYKKINVWITEGIIKKENISEVVYKDGGLTLFGAEDGVEIILGKEDQKKRLKRALTVLEDAKKRGLLIKCIDARFEKGAIIQERQV